MQYIKGAYLKNLVNQVKKEKGPEGLEQLKQYVADIDYSSIKDYPIEDEIKLHNAVMKVLYGEASSENYEKLGHFTFNMYANGMIGKTIFSLMGNDLKKIGMAAQKSIDTIAKGLNIHIEDMGGNKVKISIKNHPYDIKYYRGVFMAAIVKFGNTGTIEDKEIEPRNYEYIIEWE